MVVTDSVPGTTFSATLPDGSALPPGVTIDATTGQVSGLNPQGASELIVRILATSPEGSRTLEIKIDFPQQNGSLQTLPEFATLEDFARLSLNQPIESRPRIAEGQISSSIPSTGLPSFSQRLQDMVLDVASA